MITTKRIVVEDFKEHNIDKSYDEVFSLICRNIKLSIMDERFIYFIDENYVMDTTKGYRYENLTPNYKKILECGLDELKYRPQEITNDFCISFNSVIDNLIVLCERIIKEINDKYPQMEKQKKHFISMISKRATGFEEAIQRMLFINQVFWQTDHRLTGLGPWDALLEPYYENDLKKGVLTKREALETIRELYRTLHRQYTFKSNVLMGDTGQIFVLGMSDSNGDYVYNDLTCMFIEAMRLEHLSDPKCLLRVNKNTPRELVEEALNSIVTGIGAPLLANDDFVIPCLIQFGIPLEDAINWTTSACWEPLVFGASSSLNNMTVVNFLRPLDNLFRREKLEQIKTGEELIDKYLIYLRRNLRAVKRVLKPIRFQYNPLLSVFTDDCKMLKKDVSQGGARYHNVGVTSVAMGNLIDSLAYINDYVFDRKELSLYDVKKMILTNFKDNEGLQKELKMRKSLFGTDDDDSVELVNRIMDVVSEEISEWRSYLGGRMKIGLSGAAYLDAAKSFGASFDGRVSGDPFTVHISNEDNNAYTEIVNFASRLKYKDGRFNGNVIDYMVAPDFITNNWEKYLDFIMIAIKVGFFEMQMNVISSKTLIEAKKHPDKFPNLIVRVWGFSAYFNDLPNDYKETLIERALRNEKAG